MIDATSGSVVDDRPAGTTKLMVEADAGRKGKQPGEDAHHQVSRGPGAMSLQRKQVLAGPEDRLDPLPDRSEMRAFLLFVGSGRADDGSPQLRDLPGEVPAGVPFVADDGLSAPKRPGKKHERHLPFRPVGRSQLDAPGGAVRSASEMQPASPEIAGVAAGVAVPADLCKSRAADGLHRTGAFDRGGVKKEKVVMCPRALRAEDTEEPLDGLGETRPALVIGVLSRKNGKQMPDLPTGRPKKASVRGDAHEHLGHGQRDDLRVGGLTPGVSPPLWQKIIGCAINDGAEGVQVGAHRGLQADDVHNTVGFGPSASNPFFSAMFVASII